MLLLILFSSLIFLCFYNFYYKRRNLPPGPIPLPLVGNMLALMREKSVEEVLIKWQKQYGNVYTFWMGEDPVVNVSDYKTIQETFVKEGDAYVDRTEMFYDHNLIVKGGEYGIITTEGKIWREHRRFALHVLRDFGLGKNLMEERVLDEVGGLLERITGESKSNDEIEICDQMDMTVASVINYLMFGYRFHGEHLPEFFALKALLTEMKESFEMALLMFSIRHMSFFRRLPFFGPVIEKYVTINQKIYAFLERQIEEHQKSIDFESNSAPTDFVEAFLREAKRKDDEGLEHDFHIKQLENVCYDLYLAGQGTTTTTLTIGIGHVLLKPDIQTKLHEELDYVIGNTDRLVNMSDKQNLPYTQAVVAECQRIVNLLNMNLFRRTAREVKIGGYTVAKGVWAVPQISCVLYDENIFPNPREFNPHRFIDENGAFKKFDELIPFSVGKRQCLGESLARMELFLIVANLFNRFEFSLGKEAPMVERVHGLNVLSTPFKCRVKIRST